MVLGASALAGLVGRRQLRQMGSAQRFPLFLLFLRKIISGLFRVRRGNPGFPWFGSRQNRERVRCFAAVSAVMVTADARTASTALGPNLWD
jgi:hypothetical protein